MGSSDPILYLPPELLWHIFVYTRDDPPEIGSPDIALDTSAQRKACELRKVCTSFKTALDRLPLHGSHSFAIIYDPETFAQSYEARKPHVHKSEQSVKGKEAVSANTTQPTLSMLDTYLPHCWIRTIVLCGSKSRSSRDVSYPRGERAFNTLRKAIVEERDGTPTILPHLVQLAIAPNHFVQRSTDDRLPGASTSNFCSYGLEIVE